jgi:hypothetical protein
MYNEHNVVQCATWMFELTAMYVIGKSDKTRHTLLDRDHDHLVMDLRETPTCPSNLHQIYTLMFSMKPTTTYTASCTPAR